MKLKVSQELKYKIRHCITDNKPHEVWGLSYCGIYFISETILRYKHYHYWVKTGEITCISKKYEVIDEHDIIDIYEFYKLLQKLPTSRIKRRTRKC